DAGGRTEHGLPTTGQDVSRTTRLSDHLGLGQELGQVLGPQGLDGAGDSGRCNPEDDVRLLGHLCRPDSLRVAEQPAEETAAEAGRPPNEEVDPAGTDLTAVDRRDDHIDHDMLAAADADRVDDL